MLRWLVPVALVSTACAGSSKMAWEWEAAFDAAPPPPLPAPTAPDEDEADTAGPQGGPEVETIAAGRRDRYFDAPVLGDDAETVRIVRRDATQIKLDWPLPTTGVTSLFGERQDPVHGTKRFHYGIDLEAPYGAVVNATAPGTVVFAGWNAGHGRQVVIEHPGGFRSSYSHLAQLVVMTGVPVARGQAIGLVGNSGRSTGPHLHIEITRNGVYLDPLEVLGTTQRVP